ncbi:MAG: isoprenyl transferase [Bacillus sp. (in: firmicutes)]
MKVNWKRWLKKDASTYIDVDSLKNVSEAGVPQHIAIIMDGNGRWAKQRGLPRVAGHREGMNVVRRITRVASNMGVKALTLYAFSTENWKRPAKEVDYLMKLPVEFLGTFLPELIRENVRVNIMGDLEALPVHTRAAVEKAMEDTAHNDGLLLNLAFNYGSRAEMMLAVHKAIEDVKEGRLNVEELTEEKFSSYLMTADIPEPDLLIRTSGEIRLSNFLLWQVAYSEFYFTDVLWPDFDDQEFVKAIEEYQNRSRRYGGL